MTNIKSDISQDEFISIASDILNVQEQVSINSAGISMFPILHAGDILKIHKIEIQNIVKGDIIIGTIHQRTIGHRVVSINKSNGNYTFVTRGDNCKKNDPTIQANDVLGRVVGFTRNGKDYSFDSFYYRLFRFIIIYLGVIARPKIRILFKMQQIVKKIKESIKNTFSNIQLITKDSKKLTIQNIIIVIFQGILPFLIIYLLKHIIDTISDVNLSQNHTLIIHLELIITITGLVFLANLLVNSIGNYVREKLSQSVSLTIYALLHNKHSHLDFSHLENPEQQDMIHRATIEAGFRPNKLVSGCLNMLRSIISGIIVLILMFNIHWIIVVILFIGLLPGLFFRFRFSRKIYALNKKNSSKERQAYYYNRILSASAFAKELRLFATDGLFSSRFKAIQTKLNNEKNSISRKQLFSEILTQTVAIALIFVSFGFVTQMAIQGKITIGTVVLFFLVFQRGFSILKELFQSVASLFEDNIFFADFVSFLQIPSVPDNDSALSSITELNQGIRIENVSFQYPSSSRLALNNITMTIPAGKTIALVGANGSGKSSLIKLLCGFYEPTKGKILFDNIEITASNQQQIRAGITAVFQDFALYNMSASENIWLGNISETMDSEKIKEACSMAGIADIIESLPNSYENIIGNFFEKGEELSIGQWQKMAIARAFYRNSKILILDEPSSALDGKTEQQIIESLQSLAKDKTVLIISHRFSTIQWADIIYVMNDGKLIESGNHERLMNQKGKYFEMYSQL